MNRDSVTWSGYWPASPTPFHENGEIDFKRFGNLIKWYMDNGMHGIFLNGTTGEWFSQSISERMQVLEFVLAEVKNRVPVVVGVTTFTAKESIDLGKHAMKAGAAGVCASAPAYSKPLPDETLAYFEELSKGIDGPLMVYNWPHGTNIEIEGELASKLADIGNIVAIKNSTGDANQFRKTTQEVVERIRVFGNFMVPDNFKFLQEFGGDGTIGGGSIYGKPDPKFWEDYWNKNYSPALDHATANEVLLSKLWQPGGWRGIYGAYQSQLKAIMKMIGVDAGTVRPPRLPITDQEALKKIRTILIEYNISVS